jgi:hypothetical protein
VNVTEFFDVDKSRSVVWQRRMQPAVPPGLPLWCRRLGQVDPT